MRDGRFTPIRAISGTQQRPKIGLFEVSAWAEARIKQMTGGDPISARFMRKDFFTYTPAFKLTVAGNHKPKLKNVDEAMRRRLSIIPFMHRPARPDRQLEEKLRIEWPAILRWASAGCAEWQNYGLAPPKQVLDTTSDYFREQDVIGRWFEERCIRDLTLCTRPGQLWTDLRNWASKNGEEMTDNRSLKPWLVANGFSYRTINGREEVRGVGFRRASSSYHERTEGCSDEPERLSRNTFDMSR